MSQPRITGDSVRSYLRDIGRVPLLEHDEEILLGRKVQRLMEIKGIEAEMETPDKDDLAGVLGITSKQLRKELRDGERAKTRWLQQTSSRRLSRQEIYQEEHGSCLTLFRRKQLVLSCVRSSILVVGISLVLALRWIRQGITRPLRRNRGNTPTTTDRELQ